MTVIDKKPVPLYVEKCSECGSTFTYKKAEVRLCSYISCPVCGVSLWANFRKTDDERENAND